MKKRNWIFKIASALMMACLLTTCVISGTFAKFTSTASGSTTVKVATWDFTLNGKSASETFVIDLEDTVDTNGGAMDSEVASDVIAPGTKGSFSIELVNESQVAAECKVTFTATVKKADNSVGTLPTNLQFATEESGTYGTLAELGTAYDETLAYNSGTKNIVVYWKWNFTDTVENDFAGDEITINATIDLTQVD